MYTLLRLLPLSIFNIVHYTMLQQHKGKVPYSIKIKKKKKKEITPCVLDAELDCFEDFELKKILSQ